MIGTCETNPYGQIVMPHTACENDVTSSTMTMQFLTILQFLTAFSTQVLSPAFPYFSASVGMTDAVTYGMISLFGALYTTCLAVLFGMGRHMNVRAIMVAAYVVRSVSSFLYAYAWTCPGVLYWSRALHGMSMITNALGEVCVSVHSTWCRERSSLRLNTALMSGTFFGSMVSTTAPLVVGSDVAAFSVVAGVHVASTTASAMLCLGIYNYLPRTYESRLSSVHADRCITGTNYGGPWMLLSSIACGFTAFATESTLTLTSSLLSNIDYAHAWTVCVPSTFAVLVASMSVHIARARSIRWCTIACVWSLFAVSALVVSLVTTVGSPLTIAVFTCLLLTSGIASLVGHSAIANAQFSHSAWVMIMQVGTQCGRAVFPFIGFIVSDRPRLLLCGQAAVLVIATCGPLIFARNTIYDTCDGIQGGSQLM